MVNTLKRDTYLAAVACAIVFLVLACIACSNDFTGDAGDSIGHYLYAHYAFRHPSLFVSHWAKPLYVLLAAPFAQFGFVGIKVFNCLVASLSIFFTILTARKLNLKYSFITILIFLFSPLYFRLIFSGLTEYLGGLILIISVYCTLVNRYTMATLLISFLPFVRSEGLIILGVFAIYLLVIKKPKLLPLLLVGHVVYSIIGCFYYHDILWVFTKIPYAGAFNQYAKGGLFDFTHMLMYVIEKPNCLLLFAGFIAAAIMVYKHGIAGISKEESILVYGGFTLFFLAHSIFCVTGWFHSGGYLMPRVLNAVMPLIALIGLKGLNFVISPIKKTTYQFVCVAVFGGIIVALPFTNRAKGSVYDKNLFVIPENNLIRDKVAPYIRQSFAVYPSYKLYYSHPYISLALNIDPFDKAQHGELAEVPKGLFTGNALVIWDDWYAPVEQGMPLEDMTANTQFQQIATFDTIEGKRLIKFVVFKKATNN